MTAFWRFWLLVGILGTVQLVSLLTYPIALDNMDERPSHYYVIRNLIPFSILPALASLYLLKRSRRNQALFLPITSVSLGLILLLALVFLTSSTAPNPRFLIVRYFYGLLPNLMLAYTPPIIFLLLRGGMRRRTPK